MPVEDTQNSSESEPVEQAEKEPAVESSGKEGKGLEELLAEKEEELKQAHDRILRMAADFDNTRKRLDREKTEGVLYANESILRGLLPVIDNLERALEHGDKDENCQGVIDGVRMTLKGFLDVLAKYGVNPFESVGQPFDPNRHEAVTREQTSEYPDMTVTREFHRGYTLRDRLLRPAMVAVAQNPKTETE